jgi:hypothetical protein
MNYFCLTKAKSEPYGHFQNDFYMYIYFYIHIKQRSVTFRNFMSIFLFDEWLR